METTIRYAKANVAGKVRNVDEIYVCVPDKATGKKVKTVYTRKIPFISKGGGVDQVNITIGGGYSATEDNGELIVSTKKGGYVTLNIYLEDLNRISDICVSTKANILSSMRIDLYNRSSDGGVGYVYTGSCFDDAIYIQSDDYKIYRASIPSESLHDIAKMEISFYTQEEGFLYIKDVYGLKG